MNRRPVWDATERTRTVRAWLNARAPTGSLTAMLWWIGEAETAEVIIRQALEQPDRDVREILVEQVGDMELGQRDVVVGLALSALAELRPERAGQRMSYLAR